MLPPPAIARHEREGISPQYDSSYLQGRQGRRLTNNNCAHHSLRAVGSTSWRPVFQYSNCACPPSLSFRRVSDSPEFRNSETGTRKRAGAKRTKFLFIIFSFTDCKTHSINITFNAQQVMPFSVFINPPQTLQIKMA